MFREHNKVTTYIATPLGGKVFYCKQDIENIQSREGKKQTGHGKGYGSGNSRRWQRYQEIVGAGEKSFCYIENKWLYRREAWKGEKVQDAIVGHLKCILDTCE